MYRTTLLILLCILLKTSTAICFHIIASLSSLPVIMTLFKKFKSIHTQYFLIYQRHSFTSLNSFWYSFSLHPPFFSIPHIILILITKFIPNIQNNIQPTLCLKSASNSYRIFRFLCFELQQTTPVFH